MLSSMTRARRTLMRPAAALQTVIARQASHGFDVRQTHFDEPAITFHVIDAASKTKFTIKDGKPGEQLSQVLLRNKIPMPFSCGAPNTADARHGVGLQCGGCHVLVPAFYNAKLPEPDRFEAFQADQFLQRRDFGTTGTSRFACNIELTSDLDGVVFAVPYISENDSFDLREF